MQILVVFESILPIFLLILVGNLLRRIRWVDDNAWPGLEQLGFWFLYPVLLFVTILNADFSGLQLDSMLVALIAALLVHYPLVLALWPTLKNSGLIAESQYSSVFQSSVRWNGFMAFAIAEKIFPAEGLAVVALMMAVIIIPVNLVSVAVVTRFAASRADIGSLLFRMATNPLVLASLAALIIRWQPFGFYAPLNETLVLVGRAALGMGLIVTGAGLLPRDIFGIRLALWLPVALKLFLFPILLLGFAYAFGVRGENLNYLGLCAAVPTAMNGYLLAKQMGGDAPLYAAVTTLQTIISFFSIPLVLLIAGQLAAG